MPPDTATPREPMHRCSPAGCPLCRSAEEPMPITAEPSIAREPITFPPGTPIGYDREGVVVHVGDVAEARWNEHCGFVRGVVAYEAEDADFKAWSDLRPTKPCTRGGLRPVGPNLRVVRRWDDPRGSLSPDDPILQPSAEPWDRTVRGVMSHGGLRFYADAFNGGAWSRPDDAPHYLDGTPGVLDTVTLQFSPDEKE